MRRPVFEPIARPHTGLRRGPHRPATAIPLNLLLTTALFMAASFTHASAVFAETGIPRSASAEGARVYFITPEEGETLSSPVTVRFGLTQMGVAPAGVEKEATGHHHLIVDADLPPDYLPIPATDHYRHFGKGQTEVELVLPPGEHTLQLMLGDHNHVPHKPPVVSDRITIIVE